MPDPDITQTQEVTREYLEGRLQEFGNELRGEVTKMFVDARDENRRELITLADTVRETLDSKLVELERSSRRLTRSMQVFVDEREELSKDVRLVISGVAGLREDIYGDPDKRSGPLALYERLDRMDQRIDARFDDVVERIEKSEHWIEQRTAAERALVQIVRLPVVTVLRRFMPFVAVATGITGLASLLYRLMW